MKQHTTPFQIEILIHYCCSSEPFPRMAAPQFGIEAAKFVNDGMLEYDQYEGKYTITRKGHIFVNDGLCRVPYPIRVPETWSIYWPTNKDGYDR